MAAQWDWPRPLQVYIPQDEGEDGSFEFEYDAQIDWEFAGRAAAGAIVARHTVLAVATDGLVQVRRGCVVDEPAVGVVARMGLM